jgi:hypothetical protein
MENLARLAGSIIRVTTPRRLLADAQQSHLDGDITAKEIQAEGKSGVTTSAAMSDEEFARMKAELQFGEWMGTHKAKCEQCRKSFDDEPGPICPEAFAKMQELLRDNAPEARGPIVGIVYSASGQCLQVAQLEAGMVKNTSTTAEWVAAEKLAKSKRIGICGKKP